MANSSAHSSLTRHTNIPIDMIVEEKIITVYAETPCVSAENIDIDFFNNKLTLTIQKNRLYDPTTSEIKYGNFERTITLPISITKKETVSVSYEDGLLKIVINKANEEENRFSFKPTGRTL